ncbi:SAS2 [Candida oxycetoniae]|uniref:histone acetyltransferase n=1 Tax=Candida oxycetoniae TaxID=497107 RepID=A0AAI9STG9_9ASCO|nr:SAS2 [Candida oxycetoniae]KAI3402387.2 SAS2 [Candida oxycetoniae]
MSRTTTFESPKTVTAASKAVTFYGQCKKPSIGKVLFGKYEFEPWFGNAAYFYPHEGPHDVLGFEYANQIASNPTSRMRSKAAYNEKEYWIENLTVCEYCFKYSARRDEVTNHTRRCKLNRAKPNIGKLVYYDFHKDIIIREIRGFQEPLLCQNLCLFGKLFLDDKSVYYNIDHFNFYIYYGKDGEENFKPMAFFSKEMISYESANNLACICVFPPFQRRHIGAMLIEFSYKIAKSLSEESSGPEVPLSPFGKVAYLRFWSKSVASILTKKQKASKSFTLEELSKTTGYRKEDILYTLEHMNILVLKPNNELIISMPRFKKWIAANKYNPKSQHDLLEAKYMHF